MGVQGVGGQGGDYIPRLRPWMSAYEGYVRAGNTLCRATMVMLSLLSLGGGKARLTVWRVVGRFKSSSCPLTNLASKSTAGRLLVLFLAHPPQRL